MSNKTLANFIVECLEKEGVEYVFGIPGEENIKLVRAVHASNKIRFILVRHEQGASFMADAYGRLTGRAGVCTATLGPGAINLLLGVTNAQTDSTPVVAITAQVGLNRIYKETHQYVDLLNLFKPVTKWADIILSEKATPEMVRKAFYLAQNERPGATYLAVPQDLEGAPYPADLTPLTPVIKKKSWPSMEAIKEAVEILKTAKFPIILAGAGVVRAGAHDLLKELAEKYQIPVATTFMGKGAISDENPLALGVVGFMIHDYENFAFEKADVILSFGYELQEFDPVRINPKGDKKIIHINTFLEDTDVHYMPTIDIVADIVPGFTSLLKGMEGSTFNFQSAKTEAKIRTLVKGELAKHATNNAFPVKPQRLVNDIRQVVGRDDVVLADTGAIKMWMARLYPTYEPATCLIANGLSTMSFALPGSIGAKLARPDKNVVAVMGDGSFLMNAQEIETAVREKIDVTIVVWVDGSYGLIKWKMDMEEGAHDSVDFTNPDFVKFAESFGAKGYHIQKTEDFKPTLQKAMAEKGVKIIACPVDYSENMLLTKTLGNLTISL